MVNRNLGSDALQRFLEEPLVATLATYRKDGSVLLSPVWHEWRDGGFNIVIGSDDVKARCLRRDPRASVAVYQNAPPYRGVELRTTVRFVENDPHAIIERVAVRYLGERMGRAYSDATAKEDFTSLRLEPGDLRSWDYGDILPAEGR